MTRFLELLLLKQDEEDAAVPKTSIENYHDLRDVREVGSKGNVDNLGHDYICINLLEKKICISCNDGGELLVCRERGCPVTVHAKCIRCEPKFDDMGNFYCSYCWLKRALAEVQELRDKVLIAKKYLSNFLDDNMVTRNKLAQKNGETKRKEPEEESLVENGSSLNYSIRQVNASVHSQPLQTVEDQRKEMEGVTASADQHGIEVEDEVHPNDQVVNSGDSIHYRGAKMPVPIELVHKSMNGKKSDVHDMLKTHETRFVEGKEGIEPEDQRCNDEEVHEGIVQDGKEAEPLGASHLRTYTNGHSPDIAFAKGAQESVAVSMNNKDMMKDREKVLQNELKMPATCSSVSETNDSDFDAPSVNQRRVKQRARRYPHRASSVRTSLSLNRNAEGESAHHTNEEVISSKTLREAQVPSKQGSVIYFCMFACKHLCLFV